MTFIKYLDLEPIKRLRNEGRELLGKPIYLTEKRDGSNIPVWLNKQGLPVISSHNRGVPDKSLYAQMKATPEYKKIVDLLLDERNQWHRPNLIAYGELLLKISPTRLEPRRKYQHWILFDIYDKDKGRFDDYVKVYQLGFHFNIPVVRAFDKFIPPDINDLNYHIAYGLKWCATHKREGLVGKCYGGSEEIFFKEKRDIPVLPKIPHKGEVKPQYPEMPSERIERALQHSIDQVGVDNWENKSQALPMLARQLETEGREHCFNMPRNVYQIYLESLTNDKYRMAKSINIVEERLK